jgi:hypothetical protein
VRSCHYAESSSKRTFENLLTLSFGNRNVVYVKAVYVGSTVCKGKPESSCVFVINYKLQEWFRGVGGNNTIKEYSGSFPLSSIIRFPFLSSGQI